MWRALVGIVSAGTVALAAVLALAEERKPGPLPGKYVGEGTCKKCHFKQDKTWKATAHAKAYEVLPPKYKDDATCVACHATGAGQPGGFESSAKTPELGGVQCEMCHGPGADHAEFAKANDAKKDDPAVKAKLIERIRPSGADACVRCHLAQAHGKHPDYEKQ
jgi:hypothetical protein